MYLKKIISVLFFIFIFSSSMAADAVCKFGVGQLTTSQYHLIIDGLKENFKKMKHEEFSSQILKVIDMTEEELNLAIKKIKESNPSFKTNEIRYALILKSSYCY